MFHISDIKKYLRCPKLFWLNFNKTEKEPFNNYVRIDEAITDLAKEKLWINDCFHGERGDDCSVALKALNEYEWLVKARFEYHNLRIKVPFMHKTENGYDIFFLYLGHFPKENDLVFYKANLWVLEKLNISINNIYIIHFNSEYVRGDELDVNELFNISTSFYNDSNNPTKPIKEAIENSEFDFEMILDQMEVTSSLHFVPSIRTNKCMRRNKCDEYDNCFKDEKEISPDSILTLVSSRNKYMMYDNGIESLKDADLSLVEGTRLQFAQIKASMLGGLYYDYYALKTWMKQIHYPIAFIDFEWETYAVPPFKGLKPYNVVCFQYSIHILKENGDITHHEYLGTHDCREEFITSLINDIPKDASVVAFNADGAEKIRLKELGVQFPQYACELNDINNRMVDLSLPFSQGLIYDVRMKGYYSLKVLLSVIDDKLSYQDIDIHHGMDAVFSWRKIDKGEECNVEEIKKTLLEYCGLDSYAMIIVYKYLMRLINEREGTNK